MLAVASATKPNRKMKPPLENNVAALQAAFLSIREMPILAMEYVALLDAAGVTDKALEEAGLAVTGSVLCRADGSEIIADLGDGTWWPHGVRSDRARFAK